MHCLVKANITAPSCINYAGVPGALGLGGAVLTVKIWPPLYRPYNYETIISFPMGLCYILILCGLYQ